MMTATDIAFAPLLPWPWLAALAALALGLAGLGLARQAPGGWARLAVALVLLAALANPRLPERDSRALPDIAVILVDQSPSQSLSERPAQTEAALAQLQARLGAIPDLEVRVERVTNPAGPDQGTRLFAALDSVLAGLPRRRLAGVIAITDGRVHDLPADAGQSLGAPLHALLTGRPHERDRRLAVVKAPAFALTGRSAPLVFKVEEKGGAGEARVSVRVDGRPFATLGVPLNRDASLEIPVSHAGQTVVELEAEPAVSELTLDNNRAAVAVSGVRDRLKVLLVSGEPHAGLRVWRDLLKADPGVDLVHFTILRPPEKDDRVPVRELSLIAFPVRELFEDKLNDFDLVIFDRFRRRGALANAYYRNLNDYVRKGGALLVSVGPEFAEPNGLAQSPLAEILPALPQGGQIPLAFRPALTETGRRHPVTAGLPGSKPGESPWGGWMRQMAVGPVKGQTLMTGAENRPLLILDRVGEGRVGMILSDTPWLWARGWEGGGPHAELLRRMAHWLMKEPELEERQLAAEIKGETLTVTRRSPQPGPARVTVTAPDGSVQTFSLADQGFGAAQGLLPATLPGLWRVEDESGQTALAAAGSIAALEMAEPTATAEILAPVARATGGGLVWLAEGGVPEIRRVGSGPPSGRGWIGLRKRADSVTLGLRDVALIPGWLLALAGLGGLLAAWRSEGRR